MRLASDSFAGFDSLQRERTAQVLISAVRRLAGTKTVQAIAEVVRSAARELVQADGATFVLRERDGCRYLDEDAIAPLWKGQRFPLDACISGWAMTHREQVFIPDIYLDARVPLGAYRPTFVKSVVMTPVRSENPVAAIGVYWATSREPSTTELAFLQDLADSTAIAMENATLYQDLERRVEERTQELVTLHREVEAFSYTVAHDLRSPLSIITGFASLAERVYGQSLAEEGREMLQHILRGAREMDELITGLLDFARCARAPMERMSASLSALARDIAQRLAYEHRGRDIGWNIEDDLVAQADPRLMRVVLTNLLGNAVKFTSKRAHAEIAVGRVAEAEVPTFYVRDNGAGFDASKAHDLFAPFQRLHPEGQFEGTGVGLSTVARVVHRHGGKVWAESQPGQGAAFFFSLPATNDGATAMATATPALQSA